MLPLPTGAGGGRCTSASDDPPIMQHGHQLFCKMMQKVCVSSFATSKGAYESREKDTEADFARHCYILVPTML